MGSGNLPLVAFIDLGHFLDTGLGQNVKLISSLLT